MTRSRPNAGPPSLPPILASVCVASIALVAPSSAHADGLTFNLPWLGASSYSFTNTTIALYRNQNFNDNFYDDRIFGFTERFDSALTSGPFRLQLRLDAFAPLLTTPVDSAQCRIPSCDYLRADIRLERIQLRYHSGPVTVEAGDVYTVIGRGIALAFRKIDQLGLDNAIRGGRVEIDTPYVNIRGFGGVANPQNLDPITQQVSHDDGGAIAGGPCWTCATVPAGSTTQRYGGSDVLGGVSKSEHGKDYRNYLVSPDGSVADLRRIYSAAPSLERYDVQYRSNSNTRGGRLQFEYALRPSHGRPR